MLASGSPVLDSSIVLARLVTDLDMHRDPVSPPSLRFTNDVDDPRFIHATSHPDHGCSVHFCVGHSWSILEPASLPCDGGSMAAYTRREEGFVTLSPPI